MRIEIMKNTKDQDQHKDRKTSSLAAWYIYRLPSEPQSLLLEFNVASHIQVLHN